MFQRVLDFKKGITAPKVVMDNSQRAMALNVGLVCVWLFVEVIGLFVCEYGSDDGVHRGVLASLIGLFRGAYRGVLASLIGLFRGGLERIRDYPITSNAQR